MMTDTDAPKRRPGRPPKPAGTHFAHITLRIPAGMMAEINARAAASYESRLAVVRGILAAGLEATRKSG
jgi:hypothetical protein